MPISESELRNPSFVKTETRYPLIADKNARYLNSVVPLNVNIARNPSSDGSGWKQPGYSPSHNSITTERINLTTDKPTLRPY